jgi:nucleoside-diphosphate-sugar epimerase
MRLLVLGGTGFVGPAFVEEALRRGWDVTVFNRGNAPVPDGVTALTGDRRDPSGLKALADGAWDITVDTWSWAPSAVRDAARMLADRTDRYVYVSSRSVYRDPLPPASNERFPLVEASQDDGHVDYARAKAGGEQAATAVFGDRTLLLRAGLVLGPGENIGRLPWWLNRIAEGGPVLAPGPADAGIQFIDVRDLAGWSLDAAQRSLGGPYDLVSPVGHATMRSLLEACVAVVGSDAELRWIDPELILAAGVEPWTDLPVWLPPGPLHEALQESDVSKAVAAGLTFRPVTETVADTWAWLRARGGKAPLRPDRPPVGLDPDRESYLLRQSNKCSN